VIKVSAAEPKLLKHSGRAIVFDSYNEMNARIDDPALEVDRNSVLVLRNAGPKGAPGMPEWGNLPIPQKLLKTGVRDMVRISDARMSGTNYGTCVLHVAPESFMGGPLALLKEGDTVELDVQQKQLSMQITDEELSRRRQAWRPKGAVYPRGYGKLFVEHVKQADEGCDFDFLEGTAPIPEAEIH
jgi:dihydroxyacid dehydratase/phosphogluconate dehydratase